MAYLKDNLKIKFFYEGELLQRLFKEHILDMMKMIGTDADYQSEIMSRMPFLDNEELMTQDMSRTLFEVPVSILHQKIRKVSSDAEDTSFDVHNVDGVVFYTIPAGRCSENDIKTFDSCVGDFIALGAINRWMSIGGDERDIKLSSDVLSIAATKLSESIAILEEGMLRKECPNPVFG